MPVTVAITVLKSCVQMHAPVMAYAAMQDAVVTLAILARLATRWSLSVLVTAPATVVVYFLQTPTRLSMCAANATVTHSMVDLHVTHQCVQMDAMPTMVKANVLLLATAAVPISTTARHAKRCAVQMAVLSAVPAVLTTAATVSAAGVVLIAQ
jgi:hypothetical protein